MVEIFINEGISDDEIHYMTHLLPFDHNGYLDIEEFVDDAYKL